MTREEQIKQAVESNLDVSFYTPQDGELLKETFYIGAKWADENPQSPWISVQDDLPCNHKGMIINADSLVPTTKKVLVYNKNKEIRVAWMLYRKDKGWVWDIAVGSTPLFFMFIPELPKE